MFAKPPSHPPTPSPLPQGTRQQLSEGEELESVESALLHRAAQKQFYLSILSRHFHISKVSRRPQRSQLSSLAQLKALALSSLDEQEIIQATCEPSKVEIGREESAQSADQISRHLGTIKLLQAILFGPLNNQPLLIMLGTLGMKSFPRHNGSWVLG